MFLVFTNTDKGLGSIDVVSLQHNPRQKPKLKGILQGSHLAGFPTHLPINFDVMVNLHCCHPHVRISLREQEKKDNKCCLFL